MKKILHGIDLLSEWSGKIFAFLLLVIMVILLFEVLMRYVFNAQTPWEWETSQHLFGVYAIMAGAYVLLNKEHVKVDVIYGTFSFRTRAIIDSITYLLFFVFVIAILINGTMQAADSIRLKEVSFSPFAPPIWPLKLSIPIGALLLLLQGIAHWIRGLKPAFTAKDMA